MSSAQDLNLGALSSLLSSSSTYNYRSIEMNKDLFNRMALPACFQQCSRTDIDIVFMNEMECTYKCVITYKQAFQMLKDLERQ